MSDGVDSGVNAPAAGLARRLGLATATALVVGEVIGVFIFRTPASMVKTLGSPFWLLAVWLVMGASAIGGALCYGALAVRYPAAGGGYVYLREAYGPRTAFLYGWLSLFVTDPGLTAALAVGLERYVGYLAPFSPWGLKAVAVAAIVALAAVNMLGVTLGAGMLIAFATAPGHVALDGEGANSPFAAALSRHIATTGLEVPDADARSGGGGGEEQAGAVVEFGAA